MIFPLNTIGWCLVGFFQLEFAVVRTSAKKSADLANYHLRSTVNKTREYGNMIYYSQ